MSFYDIIELESQREYLSPIIVTLEKSIRYFGIITKICRQYA